MPFRRRRDSAWSQQRGDWREREADRRATAARKLLVIEREMERRLEHDGDVSIEWIDAVKDARKVLETTR